MKIYITTNNVLVIEQGRHCRVVLVYNNRFNCYIMTKAELSIYPVISEITDEAIKHLIIDWIKVVRENYMNKNFRLNDILFEIHAFGPLLDFRHKLYGLVDIADPSQYIKSSNLLRNIINSVV